MPLAILAFVFGALLFLMSTAVLALEPPPNVTGIARLALLALATLHAASGFLALGGAPAFAESRWGVVAGCAATSTASTTMAALVAFRLAAVFHLGLSQDAAIFVVVSTLAAGIAGIVLVILHTRKHPKGA